MRNNQQLTSGCSGQISAVTFCAKTSTKTAIKNLLGEPGVRHKNEKYNHHIYVSSTNILWDIEIKGDGGIK